MYEDISCSVHKEQSVTYAVGVASADLFCVDVGMGAEVAFGP